MLRLQHATTLYSILHILVVKHDVDYQKMYCLSGPLICGGNGTALTVYF
jgi:hypothetical protein